MDMDPNNISFKAILANKYVKIGSIIFIVINVLLLNAFVFIASRQTSINTIASNQQKIITTPALNLPAGQAAQPIICATCEARLDQAVAMIKNIQTALSAAPKPATNPAPIPTPTSAPASAPTVMPAATSIPTPTPARTTTGTPTPTVIVAGVKEYYVLFGSGNSSSSDWTDVSGLQTSINTALYPTIKTAKFEVGGHTPTGNETIWVRLYNVTNNYPVINSEITWDGGESKYIISNLITLASGNKTYKVQMKTQLNYVSYIDSAKIHLVLY